MRTVTSTLALAIMLLAPLAVWAQPPGGGDRGSRGGPGGFPGGGFPGGGPPGGGFGSRGGDPGASRGGDRGSRGGEPGGGGFNPADMLRRFDRNGNNMIDPDEAQGPAQFFLQRLAQNNPKIDLKKPIPIDQLTGEIDRMRGGGGGDSSSRGDSAASNEPELLVPDFKLESEPVPVEGFGMSSALFSVKVEERDLAEAEDRMRRYDQNKDGVLSQDELRSGRWSDDPMQYDRNRDGKLNKSEMAMRYANRRVEDQQRREQSNDPRNRGGESGGWGRGGENGWGRSEPAKEEPKVVDRFGEAKSYRTGSGKATEGLPDFFARSDADGDGQVLMHEFSNDWSQSTLEEFLKWDLNRDGIIIPQECLAALANGTRVSGSTASAPAPAASSGASPSSANVDPVAMDWAKRQIGKYDTNADGTLTANEWEKMLIKPTGADSDGDGVITVQEYAQFRSKK